MADNLSWDSGWKSYEEANKNFVLPPEDFGYVLRIDDVSDPYESKYVYPDPKTGLPKKPAIKTSITLTIVDYANDDPTNSVIGQWLKMFPTISMHTKAVFYDLVKNAFGGDVDPRWKPNKRDLIGKLVSASIGHKPPNAEGRVYAKVTKVLPYRGKTNYDHVPVWQPSESDAPTETVEEGDDVPF